jgi:hypothetical protein
MKRIYLFILLAALNVCTLHTYAKEGDSCSDPILLTSDYRETITRAGDKWYIANTFDLPLAIDFYPTYPNDPAPEMYLDFGCTPGVYDDPILCGLFCSSNSAYIALPYHETPSASYDENNKKYYHVAFGASYRDLLLRQGIDYNVQVYVKVKFSGPGTLSMVADPFNNCMDGHKFIHLGDTVNVQTRDKDRHVVVPYVQWQYDSIRYVWTGTTPCTIAIGNTCGFDPTDADDPTIMDGGVIQPDGQFKVSSALLMQYVSDQVNYPNDAGMYFAKFYSEAPGVMKIEKIPAPRPEANATLLKYGIEATVLRNDTSALYAMPDSWVKDMQFFTPTSRVFKMYIGTTPNFYTKDAVVTYQFDRTDDGHLLSLVSDDMEAIWSHKVSGNYLYVRFECSENTTVLPRLWAPSPCVEKAKRIEAGVQFEVAARATANYGLFYADWKGGDMTIAWTATQATCPFYIADTCNVPNSNVSPVFYTDKAPKRGSVTIPSSTVDSWETYVDPDGYIYIRFYSTAKGKITVTTNAPEEEDPQCTPADSTLVVTAWDSYEWNGVSYTESGVYTKDGNVDPETGCIDTIFTLRLTIHTTSYDTYEESGCDSIFYNGKKYTESGAYTDTLYDADGNRTIMALTFTVHQSTRGEEVLTGCDSLYWNGEWRKVSGDYEYHTTNVAGCDSTAILHLTIYHSYAITLPDTTVCETVAHGGYIWHDAVLGDTTIHESGIYTRSFKSKEGCDSLVQQTVTILLPNTGDTTVVACESFVWYGTTYTQSAEPTYTFTNIQGCDSVVTLHLTINYATTSEETRSEYESYTWNEVTYTQSGDYTFETTNAAGCDSTAILHLTIKERPSIVYDTVYFCRGFNTVHEEKIADDRIRRYLPYVFESPATWDYMEGAIISGSHDRTLVDLKRVETNLKNHYTKALTPVEHIAWSVREANNSVYTPIVATDQPQWIPTGGLILQIHFRCGELYNNEFPMAVEEVEADKQPVKRIENGQIVIMYNGTKYNVQGQKIK